MMKHIPTTATVIRKIKTAAKRIRDEQGISLGQAQDVAAQAVGYAHFHHASTCVANTEPGLTALFGGLGQLQFVVEDYAQDWITYDDNGNERGSVRRFAGMFLAGLDNESLDVVTEELDDVSDEIGGGMGDMSVMEPSGLKRLIRCCQRLTGLEPAFLDGYAHWAGALVTLNHGAEGVAIARPVYDAAIALLPTTFKGYIPYSYLENRPFHRLAVNLLLAYDQMNQPDEAKAIAQRMLKWWPNDNIGFRFLLSDIKEFGRIKRD